MCATKKTLVSICITNYNYGNYVEAAIKSAAEQTYDNIEIIVLDDASTDNSIDILAKLKDKYNFRLIQNKKNIGMLKNFSQAGQEASGDYLTFLDADDVMTPDFAADCLNVFKKHDVGLVAAEISAIDENGQVSLVKPFFKNSAVIKGQSLAKILLMTNCFFTSQFMVKKSAYQAIDGFNLGVTHFSDRDFCFRLALKYDIGYLQEPRILYRQHSSNSTSAAIKNFMMVFEKYTLLMSFFKQVKGNAYLESFREEAVKKIGHNCLFYAFDAIKNAEYDLAKKYAMLAPFFDETILENDDYRLLTFVNSLQKKNQQHILSLLENSFYDHGTLRPYDVPEGSIIL
jgi:glycosyltransferase involved in cell wall biosynthesis